MTYETCTIFLLVFLLVLTFLLYSLSVNVLSSNTDPVTQVVVIPYPHSLFLVVVLASPK